MVSSFEDLRERILKYMDILRKRYLAWDQRSFPIQCHSACTCFRNRYEHFFVHQVGNLTRKQQMTSRWSLGGNIMEQTKRLKQQDLKIDP